MRKKYETDLTDEQWEVIAPLFVNMRKRKWEKRELVNAVLYLVKMTRQKAGLLLSTLKALKQLVLSLIRCDSQSEFEQICGDSDLLSTRQINISAYGKKLKPHGWQVLPKRWIVERTFA